MEEKVKQLERFNKYARKIPDHNGVQIYESITDTNAHILTSRYTPQIKASDLDIRSLRITAKSASTVSLYISRTDPYDYAANDIKPNDVTQYDDVTTTHYILYQLVIPANATLLLEKEELDIDLKDWDLYIKVESTVPAGSIDLLLNTQRKTDDSNFKYKLKEKLI